MARDIARDIDGDSSRNLCFRFTDLPLVIRDLIWEAILPPSRVFHVNRCHDNPEGPCHPLSSPQPQSLRFYTDHPPPVIASVCKESCAVALRRGFFFSSCNNFPGVWFNPERDILYFNRNLQYLFKHRGGKPLMSVAGLDRVLNVGMGWRACFHGAPRPLAGDDMRS